MNTRDVWSTLLDWRYYDLESLCREFECPEGQGGFCRGDLLNWCRDQGQWDHLTARVEELENQLG